MDHPLNKNQHTWFELNYMFKYAFKTYKQIDVDVPRLGKRHLICGNPFRLIVASLFLNTPNICVFFCVPKDDSAKTWRCKANGGGSFLCASASVCAWIVIERMSGKYILQIMYIWFVFEMGIPKFDTSSSMAICRFFDIFQTHPIEQHIMTPTCCLCCSAGYRWPRPTWQVAHSPHHRDPHDLYMWCDIPENQAGWIGQWSKFSVKSSGIKMGIILWPIANHLAWVHPHEFINDKFGPGVFSCWDQNVRYFCFEKTTYFQMILNKICHPSTDEMWEVE